MRILFLGGTSFVGRHLAEVAIERGHEITLFHRGRTGTSLFPGSEHIVGDRDGDLHRLAGRTWDAAIDVCAYVPRQVAEAARILRASIGRYCLISTVRAFDTSAVSSLDEASPLLGASALRYPATDVVDTSTYGPLKSLCEAEAHRGFGDRVLVVRPTYVIGPYDVTDRFTYWVRRASSGGEILAAGPSDAPIQLIDARDLASFTVGLLEHGADGAYCAVGPPNPITWDELLERCLKTVGTEGFVTWVDPEFLREQQVEVESAVPFWLAPNEFPLMRCAPGRSLAAGLSCRPLEDSMTDTLAWDERRGRPPLLAALTPENERALLDAWHVRRPSEPDVRRGPE